MQSTRSNNPRHIFNLTALANHHFTDVATMWWLNQALTTMGTNSPFLSSYFSYKSTGEKLLKYQENLPRVIISLILMTLMAE